MLSNDVKERGEGVSGHIYYDSRVHPKIKCLQFRYNLFVRDRYYLTEILARPWLLSSLASHTLNQLTKVG